jgi:acetyltransferase-like isoleucine patch superfamily enzyme
MKLILKNLSLRRPLWRIYARLCRAEVHPSVVMNGRPFIRCVRGAFLQMREGVEINTSVASNPVIGNKRTALCVVLPGARMEIERKVGMSGVCITAAKEVIIGEGTFLGADVLITDTDFHSPDGRGSWTNATQESARPVRIGKGCFVGARAIILKGVTIGDGAVVGAGAVVVNDVPAEHLAVGNPATTRPLPAKWLQRGGLAQADLGSTEGKAL